MPIAKMMGLLFLFFFINPLLERAKINNIKIIHIILETSCSIKEMDKMVKLAFFNNSPKGTCEISNPKSKIIPTERLTQSEIEIK